MLPVVAFQTISTVPCTVRVSTEGDAFLRRYDNYYFDKFFYSDVANPSATIWLCASIFFLGETYSCGGGQVLFVDEPSKENILISSFERHCNNKQKKQKHPHQLS